MHFFFSFLFFSFSIFCFFFGFVCLSFNSVSLDMFIPYSLFYDLSLSFMFDYVSLFFFSAVSLISSVVFLYSKYYMSITYYNNSDNNRFLYLLFLFVTSMFFLVFSSSWVTVMLGWDGLGLVSFLLVIYYNDSVSLDSGLITVFTNRIGDCFFILSFIFMFYCGWFSFDYLVFSDFFLFSFLVILGCITKSAQMPFSSWLPAAMAAPTPVSSLVHSSTLVTAGVYLLIRFNYLFSVSCLMILGVVSLFTMSLAGIFALYELDFKKVVAMSTLSQLGFMIFSVSLGYWLMGFIHMIFHAFFKSSLFLSTGNLMHFFLGNQDSRFFGSLNNSFFSKLFFSMSCLSLMGFPFSLGFYSKDMIMGSLLYDFSFLNIFFVFSCGFTIAYSLRLLCMGFMNFPSFSNSLSFTEDYFFFLPVMVLYFFCLLGGNFFFFCFVPVSFYSFFDYFIGMFVILLGILIFKGMPNFYFFNYSFIYMFFLSLLSSFSSTFMKSFSYKWEYSWMEIVAPKSLNLMFSFFFSYAVRLYEVKFLHIFIFMGMIYSLWVWFYV